MKEEIRAFRTREYSSETSGSRSFPPEWGEGWASLAGVLTSGGRAALFFLCP